MNVLFLGSAKIDTEFLLNKFLCKITRYLLIINLIKFRIPPEKPY